MKIVMLEPLGISEEKVLNLAKPFVDAGHTFEFCGEKIASENEQINKAKDADVLIIANSPLSGKVINAAPNLKMISVAFTGVDHVDAAACKERGIIVSNAQGYCTDAVAELVFGLILTVFRNIIPCHIRTKEGGTKDGLVGNEVNGKTIGIIGTGAIGRRVGEIAKVLNCKLIGFDTYQSQEAIDMGIEYMELDQVFKKADIITLHTPLTEETKHLVNEKRLALMKPTAIIINAARGPVVDSEALAEALNSGRIAGAGIDVYEVEPPVNTDHPLLNANNVVVTPHIAFATKESIYRRAEITFENIAAWEKGKPQNVRL
jgi:phosphoglycerate dehydrogenase-like enzyme